MNLKTLWWGKEVRHKRAQTMITNKQIYSDRNQKSLHGGERRRLVMTRKGQKATSLGDGNVPYPELGT